MLVSLSCIYGELASGMDDSARNLHRIGSVVQSVVHLLAVYAGLDFVPLAPLHSLSS